MHGATACSSAAEAAGGVDVVFIMPRTVEQVREAITGHASVLASATPGTTVVVSSTISPSDARSLADACASSGLQLIDAPVCRGEADAEAADLLWFVGGDEQVVNTVSPVMEPCGREIFHLGPIGAGMVGKAMNNLLLWAAVVADREAIEPAGRFGIDTPTLIAGLLRSSGMNQFLNLHGTIDRFPWAHKDMKIVSAMSDEVQLSMPLAGTLRELVKPIMIETGCSHLITP